MLNFLSRTLTLTLKQHSFKNQTNPNPVNTFYWHPFEFVHFFMHTHPTPPYPVSRHFALWCIWKCLLLIFCFISWWQVQQVSALSIVFVLKSTVTLERGHSIFYLHPPPSYPSPTPSLPQGEFLNSGAKILFGPFWQSPTPAPRFSDTHLK